MTGREELENTPRPRVSIVIRAKNEERWIWRCLKAIRGQTLQPHEIIIVDNESCDATAQLAMRFGASKVLHISGYSPGRALNVGTDAASGEFVCYLSAHCVPQSANWLEKLIAPMVSKDIAASYGRQLPLPFTHPNDKADLYAVFRNESRVQSTDGFMNNANSVIRKSVWESIQFDEDLSNIEDRVWGQSVVDQGWKIAYVADASVFHFNGMHKSGSRNDQTTTVQVIEHHLGRDNLAPLDSYLSIFHGTFLPVLVGESASELLALQDTFARTSKSTSKYWTTAISINQNDVMESSNSAHAMPGSAGTHDDLGTSAGTFRHIKTSLNPSNRYVALIKDRSSGLTEKILEQAIDEVIRRDLSSLALGPLDARAWPEKTNAELTHGEFGIIVDRHAIEAMTNKHGLVSNQGETF